MKGILKKVKNKIIIEYKIDVRSADSFDLNTYPSKRTISLSPEDYEKAIDKIGKEVEFEEDLQTKEVGRLLVDGDLVSVEDAIMVAKLIIPSPILYTEEEVRELVRDAMSEADKDGMLMPDEWFDKHKNK